MEKGLAQDIIDVLQFLKENQSHKQHAIRMKYVFDMEAKELTLGNLSQLMDLYEFDHEYKLKLSQLAL